MGLKWTKSKIILGGVGREREIFNFKLIIFLEKNGFYLLTASLLLPERNVDLGA